MKSKHPFPSQFFWMLSLFTAMCSCIATEGSLSDQKNFEQHDDQYKRKFDVELDSVEKPLRYGYHYVVSQMPTGYRVRVFHPDKKVLTDDLHYSTPALTLLHGMATRYWDDGSIREQGIYQYGRKHGMWVESEPGRGKSSSGHYLNHRKEGEWTQLDTNGLVESIYSWKDDQRHGKFYLYDSTGQKINEGLYRADTLISELFKQARTERPYLKMCEDNLFGNVYACSEFHLIQSIQLQLRYPTAAKQHGIEGIAVVQWDVQADGSVANLRVPQSLCNEIEQECLRVFQSLPEWRPARKGGANIKYTLSIPLQFGM